MIGGFGALCFAANPPNLVLIYADDLGYGDVSCNGTKYIKTPNIDKVAAEGCRFTSGYSTSATCTPLRHGYCPVSSE